MSASNYLENGLLEHILNNDDIAGIGDATGLRGSSAAGSLYLSLHTADPGEGGSQTTNEVNYTDYARVALARDGTKWTVTGAQAVNAATVTWPTAAGGSSLATHWAIGTDSAGAGNLLFKGAMTAPLSVSNGIAPTAAAGALVINAD